MIEIRGESQGDEKESEGDEKERAREREKEQNRKIHNTPWNKI